VWVLMLSFLLVTGCTPTQIVVYSQTNLAGSTGNTPGLYDQLGLLAGPNSTRIDFYEIITNNTGRNLRVNKAILFGTVSTESTAVLSPVIIGSINGIADILVPDTDPSHVLASAQVAVGSTVPGKIEITFSPPVKMSAGAQLAFGFIVPLTNSVDATLYGTDTLPEGLSSTNPPFWTGLYSTNAFGVLSLASGKHYLVIEAIP